MRAPHCAFESLEKCVHKLPPPEIMAGHEGLISGGNVVRMDPPQKEEKNDQRPAPSWQWRFWGVSASLRDEWSSLGTFRLTVCSIFSKQTLIRDESNSLGSHSLIIGLSWGDEVVSCVYQCKNVKLSRNMMTKFKPKPTHSGLMRQDRSLETSLIILRLVNIFEEKRIFGQF